MRDITSSPAINLAPMIDHTLLRCDATHNDIVALCEEARAHGFAAVCVNSAWVALCAATLAGTSVAVCAVVGFPLGAMASAAKAYEARNAVAHGATEIDMVMNIGAVKSHDYEAALDDMRQVVEAAAPAAVKVILETALLTRDEKIAAALLAKRAGAAFVKTSTGFGHGGATTDDVQLLRATVGEFIGVKASGGVRTSEDALNMVQAGATRIGSSASVAMVANASAKKERSEH